MVHYKLVYFNARGRAEVSRYLFAVAGVPYEDKRIPIVDEWKELEPDTPFGTLPYLDIGDGKKYGQGKAIGKYLALEFGLAGKNNLEHLLVDQIVECCEDIMDGVYKIFHTSGEAEKKTVRENLKKNTIMPSMNRLEALVQPSGHFVGDSITLADLAFFHMQDAVHRSVQTEKEHEANKDKFPKLKALIGKVQAHPAVAKWIAERPDA